MRHPPSISHPRSWRTTPPGKHQPEPEPILTPSTCTPIISLSLNQRAPTPPTEVTPRSATSSRNLLRQRAPPARPRAHRRRRTAGVLTPLTFRAHAPYHYNATTMQTTDNLEIFFAARSSTHPHRCPLAACAVRAPTGAQALAHGTREHPQVNPGTLQSITSTGYAYLYACLLLTITPTSHTPICHHAATDVVASAEVRRRCAARRTLRGAPGTPSTPPANHVITLPFVALPSPSSGSPPLARQPYPPPTAVPRWSAL